jgi:hypothetical protein
MAEQFETSHEGAELPVDESAEPIFIRKLDRLETTRPSNSQGA